MNPLVGPFWVTLVNYTETFHFCTRAEENYRETKQPAGRIYCNFNNQVYMRTPDICQYINNNRLT